MTDDQRLSPLAALNSPPPGIKFNGVVLAHDAPSPLMVITLAAIRGAEWIVTRLALHGYIANADVERATTALEGFIAQDAAAEFWGWVPLLTDILRYLADADLLNHDGMVGATMDLMLEGAGHG